ncbi:MAG: UDP-2,3-diacylglucosamine diphosphatase [Nitrospiraceae bacterium]|jgi:UDP-2,3-diacylglucosamine pyrophosphatase LpxH|nr:UDP-2,3-diacylglucosamine diphosphatase [Nitrospiraceae bacterium]
MTRYRSIFISDVHLGTRDCRVELLLDFLRETECDTLYLVGDILDFWQLKRNWFWPESHSTVIQKILRKSRHGTKVVYIQGNHDPVHFFLDKVLERGGVHFGDLEIAREWIHRGVDGRRYLVIHGDAFDLCLKTLPWLTRAGDWGYSVLLRINQILCSVNRFLGRTSRWSLSRAVKNKVKKVTRFIGEYEGILAMAAKNRGMEGVICGHIHFPACQEREGVLYLNTGDWVEHGSALVEHHTGHFEVLLWNERHPACPEGTKPRDAILGENLTV